jgi:hypothetical protein
VLPGKSLPLALQLTPASPGLFERGGGTVSLLLNPRQLLTQVAIVVGSLRRLLFPLLSALADLGPLAHHVRSRQETPLQATGGPWVR